MTRKEYRQMTEMVCGLPPSVRKDDLIEALIQTFKESNVRFDRELFIKACTKELTK